MSQAALHPMLNIAIAAARKAGAIINRASLDLERVQVSVKSHNDFVTEVDQAAEEAIIDTLLTAYPGHAILAEESGRSRGAKDSDYLWIIDPLDGTTNFIHGFPVFAVSIALSFRGQIQQAVVYDPSRNDLFYASKGKGAYLNDRRLRVSKRIRMSEALIGTGFQFRKNENFKRYMEMFEAVISQCAGLRRPGAAALDLCYVAAGFYDGFFETGLSPWDIAAGALMITEAGGLIGNFTGEADYLYQREVVAGTPKVYGHLVQTLTPFTRVIKEEHVPAEAAAETSSESDAPLLALEAAVHQEQAQDQEPAKPKVRSKRAATKVPGEIGSDDGFVDPFAPSATRAEFVPVIAPSTSTVKREPIRIRKPAEPATRDARSPSRDDRSPRDNRDSRGPRQDARGGSRSDGPRGPVRTTAARGPRGGSR